VDGFINFLKPPGMTSHDVVAFIRKQLRIKKVGHTGTLDPGVAGVLPICVGKATRLAEYIVDRPKSYRAEMTLGITTDSQDAYGQVLSQNDCTGIKEEDLKKVLLSFCGPQSQIPPMTSAIRQGGVRLYNLARQGIEIERKPRHVTIYRINLIKSDWQLPFPKVIFDVQCSKGTYIRALCHDIGKKLGVGAYMSFLIRTQTGIFSVNNAWTGEEIAASLRKDDFSFISPMEEGISFIPVIAAGAEQVRDLIHGKTVVLPRPYPINKIYQVHDENNKLIAIGRVVAEKENILFKPDKVLASS